MTFPASLKVQGRRAAGAGGRHADEGREPAEDEGDDLLTPPVVSALKKKRRRKVARQRNGGDKGRQK